MLPKWAWLVCIVTKYMYSVNFVLLFFVFNIFVCSCRSRTCLNEHTRKTYQRNGQRLSDRRLPSNQPEGQTARRTENPETETSMNFALCKLRKKNKLFQFLQLHFKGETLALASLLPAAPLFPVSTHPHCFFLV